MTPIHHYTNLPALPTLFLPLCVHTDPQVPKTTAVNTATLSAASASGASASGAPASGSMTGSGTSTAPSGTRTSGAAAASTTNAAGQAKSFGSGLIVGAIGVVGCVFGAALGF